LIIEFNIEQNRSESQQMINKGNNKITELRTILQRESQNSLLYKQTKSVNNQVMKLLLNKQIKDTKDHRRCKHETGSYESGRFGALKSDSTHHFFRNACTKSGSLRFSQFSGC
jgi:hypothetical protein